MRSWKRSLPMLLVTLVILSLTACGGSNQNNLLETDDSPIRIITVTPRNTAAPTITPTPLVPALESGALEGTQIDFWYFWDPTTPDTLDTLVGIFNSENEHGIEVVPRQFTYPADFEDAVQEAIATRRTPHVALANPYQYNAWREVGALVEMTPYLESPVYGLATEDLDDFYPPILDRDVYGDARFGFPGLLSARVLLYNQTWAQELGFEAPPASAAAFTRQACTAHDASGDRTGGWMIDTSPGSAAAWLLAFEENLETGSRYAFESDGVEAAFNFLSDLQVQGCAWQPTDAYPDQAFVDRQGLFYPVSTWEIRYVEEAFSQSTSTDQWTAIAYPNDLGESRISLYGASYVMFESSLEEQISAWLFIRWLSSAPNQVRFAETHHYLPLTREVSSRLQVQGDLPEAWRESLTLLEQAVYEPRFTSWRVVRGVVQDAVAEVMDERFAPGTMSLFLNQLEELVDSLH